MPESPPLLPRLLDTPPSPQLPRIAGLLVAALTPVPAWAADPTVLPEPSGLVLFGIGVTGVWLGRRFSRGKRKD